MIRRIYVVAAIWLTAGLAPALADDAYYRISPDELSRHASQKLPIAPDTEAMLSDSNRESYFRPYVSLDGKGDAYVISRRGLPAIDSADPRMEVYDEYPADLSVGAIFARAPAGADLKGRLYVPKHELSGMVEIDFKIPHSDADSRFRHDFYAAEAFHYGQLVREQRPGSAWFRHESRNAREALGLSAVEAAAIPGMNNFQISGQTTEFDAYNLFSGGRAVSENLQLDRSQPAAKRAPDTVDVGSLEGISIAAIDWSEYLRRSAVPTLDPLAADIPEDQHAVFFPTFAKLMEVIDEADRQGATALQFGEPRSQDQGIRERYERQLCLSSSALARLLGPKLIRSVAVTGSDPYFATGTDVAILFDAVSPEAVKGLLVARVTAAGIASGADGKPINGQLESPGGTPIPYQGMRSADRKVCSYVARLGNVVVVTNSLVQLQHLADVQNHRRSPIANLPEYKFFRARYKLGSGDESAFLFISDATIRRWCGAKWRIASSRRTRDMALMYDLQADMLDKLVAGHVTPGPIYSDLAGDDMGNLSLTADGVESSTLGTLDFQTPIVELPLTKVTPQEAELYKRWRDSYQQNWRWAFDPIGLQIHCGDHRLAADLTVMPLIAGTDYREFLDIVRGTKITPTAGDPHDALMHFIIAINPAAQQLHMGDNFLQGVLPNETNPLSWLGSSLAIWIEDDPFWKDLAGKQSEREREEFFEHNFGRLPIAVLIDVSNRLKLTAFLVAMRGVVEQTAPGMVAWESLTYHDQAYVKLSPTERAKAQIPKTDTPVALYYAITPDGLLLTLSQRILQETIDRQAARAKAKADGKQELPPQHPWIGESVGLQLERNGMTSFGHFLADPYRSQMQDLAWANLPILNEWKHRFPDRDPVELQQQFWQTRLVCPGGGKYVWNEKWQTMESTVYGSPAEPKPGPDVPPALAEFAHANFGLTFENDGLRARVQLDRAAAKEQTEKK